MLHWPGKEAFGVGLWRDIIREANLVSAYNMFALGDGNRIWFWKDFSCGSEPLGISFPSLYSVTPSREGIFAEFQGHSRAVAGWSLRFM